MSIANPQLSWILNNLSHQLDASRYGCHSRLIADQEYLTLRDHPTALPSRFFQFLSALPHRIDFVACKLTFWHFMKKLLSLRNSRRNHKVIYSAFIFVFLPATGLAGQDRSGRRQPCFICLNPCRTKLTTLKINEKGANRGVV
jgi:hypothetical protein